MSHEGCYYIALRVVTSSCVFVVQQLADGSVAQLRRCLAEMKRDDAVKLLDNLPAAAVTKFPSQSSVSHGT